MELFSELYGCYYHVIGAILQQAHGQGMTRAEIDRLVSEKAFSESGLHLIPKLLAGEWDLLEQREGVYYSKLQHKDTALPLTNLQKAWLKALLADRRTRLFLEEEQRVALSAQLAGVEPLFHPADFHTFDVAADGDAYEDAGYRQRFRLLLAAIKAGQTLLVGYEREGQRSTRYFRPERLLYSAKDDKFRARGVLLTGGGPKPAVLNLARMQQVEPVEKALPEMEGDSGEDENRRTVTIAINEERNGLERCMLQFASYNKTTAFDEAQGRYVCEIIYPAAEETELLIRILSFGPVLEILGPPNFVQLARERVWRQMDLLQLPV